VAYARFADQATHVVLSRTLEAASWHNTRIVRSADEIRPLKSQPGKDMHAVGGASLVSTLVSAGLVDEMRIVIRPIVLGGGKAMFKDVRGRKPLILRDTRPMDGGAIRLTYRVDN
jgi:dihydrofolate reductase